jgi:two-component system chemotaxis sensor kinase CheA
VGVLDSLFNLAGELIINKNRIDNILSETPNKELKSMLAAMQRLLGELQDTVSVARMVPVREIFEKFPRMVRDLAREHHKEIELVLEGSEIELDKAILDAIGEPVLHLLRNAVDHGIEPPEERQKNNKERQGKIRLAAKRAENHILIEVEDDGRGIDTAHIKEVGVSKGFVKQEEVDLLQDRDVLNLLFQPEFSTEEKVTGLSGRGVGLYVVRTSAKELGGTVELATQIGKGTRFTLSLPMTTAIMQMLMVAVSEYVFGIPSDIIIQTLEVKPGDIKEIQNDKVLVLGNEIIPFVRLNEALNIPCQETLGALVAVIVKRGNKSLGLGVDAALDQTENIVKPFDPIAQQFKGFSGGTILGDGRVALLLDIPTLFGFYSLEEARY